MSFVISLSYFRNSAKQNCKTLSFRATYSQYVGDSESAVCPVTIVPVWAICERTRLEQRHRALKITSICQCISLGSGPQTSPIRLTPFPYAHVLTLTGTAVHAEQGSTASRQGLLLHAGISPWRAWKHYSWPCWEVTAVFSTCFMYMPVG